MSALDDALQLSRAGDVAGAVSLLRGVRAGGVATNAHLSLLFALVTMNDAADEALEIAGAAFHLAKLPIARSTWALRRGLIYLDKGHRDHALKDLQLVLNLRASEEQHTQALQALLRVAALKK